MWNVSNEFNEAFKAPSREVFARILVKGEIYRNDDLMSVKYQGGSITGQDFTIGSTFANSVRIQFSRIVEELEEMDEIEVHLGIKYKKHCEYEIVNGVRICMCEDTEWLEFQCECKGGNICHCQEVDEEGYPIPGPIYCEVIEYCPMGVFYISDRVEHNRNEQRTNIDCMDQMIFLGSPYEPEYNGQIQIRDLALNVANSAGVLLDHANYQQLSAALIDPPYGYSHREVLGLIAQFETGFVRFNREGLLQIVQLDRVDFEITPDEYFMGGLNKNELIYQLGGISVVNRSDLEAEVLRVGSPTGAQIELENSLMTQDLLNIMHSRIGTLNFFPFDLRWRGNPALEAGDWVILTDREGNPFLTPNLTYDLTFNGGLTATSSADTRSMPLDIYRGRGRIEQERDWLEDAVVGRPQEVTGFVATGLFQTINLKWDLQQLGTQFELHGSQTSGFTPSEVNLIERTNSNGANHSSNVSGTWYYVVRARTQGRFGSWSEEISATTHKIISSDILFGEEIAQELRDLSELHGIIGPDTIAQAHIQSAAITTAHIQNLAVERAHLQNAIIGTAQIEDLAVTDAKIANMSADKLTFGTATGINFNAVNITGSVIRTEDGVGGNIDMQQGRIDILDGDILRTRINRQGMTVNNDVGQPVGEFSFGGLQEGEGTAGIALQGTGLRAFANSSFRLTSRLGNTSGNHFSRTIVDGDTGIQHQWWNRLMTQTDLNGQGFFGNGTFSAGNINFFDTGNVQVGVNRQLLTRTLGTAGYVTNRPMTLQSVGNFTSINGVTDGILINFGMNREGFGSNVGGPIIANNGDFGFIWRGRQNWFDVQTPSSDAPNNMGTNAWRTTRLGRMIITSGRTWVPVNAANTTVTMTIPFNATFTTAPVVVATPHTTVPQNCSIAVTNTDLTNFQIAFHRTTAVNTLVHWIAFSRGAN